MKIQRTCENLRRFACFVSEEVKRDVVVSSENQEGGTGEEKGKPDF